MKLQLPIALIPSQYIYIYIYIYCHPQTDCFVISQLFTVARHTRCFKPWSKLYVSRISYPWANVILNISEGIFFVYLFTYVLSGTGVLNSYIYIYIYIYQIRSNTIIDWTPCFCCWKVFFKTGEPAIAFHAPFMLCRNDAVSDRIFSVDFLSGWASFQRNQKLTFSTQARRGKPMFRQFINIF